MTHAGCDNSDIFLHDFVMDVMDWDASGFNLVGLETELRDSEWTLKPKPSSSLFISALLLASRNHGTHFTRATIDISVIVLMIIHAADSAVRNVNLSGSTVKQTNYVLGE